MRILLIRHAQSWGDVESLGEANLAVGLTPNGQETARRTAEYLSHRERSVAGVFTSPVERARETANIIASALRKPVIDVPEFSEAYLGRWEGATLRDIRKNFPNEVEAFFRNPTAFQFPGGETVDAFVNRLSAGLDRVTKTRDGDTVIVVSHGIAIGFLLCRFLEQPLIHSLTYDVPNCGVTIFEGRGLKSLRLVGQIGETAKTDVHSVIRLDTAFWGASFAIAFGCLVFVANASHITSFSINDARNVALVASLFHFARYWMKFGFKWARFLPALSNRHQGLNVLIMAVGCASILTALYPRFLFSVWTLLYALVWAKYKLALREAIRHASLDNIDWLKDRTTHVPHKLWVNLGASVIALTVGNRELVPPFTVLLTLLYLNVAYGAYGILRDIYRLFWSEE